MMIHVSFLGPGILFLSVSLFERAIFFFSRLSFDSVVRVFLPGRGSGPDLASGAGLACLFDISFGAGGMGGAEAARSLDSSGLLRGFAGGHAARNDFSRSGAPRRAPRGL